MESSQARTVNTADSDSATESEADEDIMRGIIARPASDSATEPESDLEFEVDTPQVSLHVYANVITFVLTVKFCRPSRSAESVEQNQISST